MREFLILTTESTYGTYNSLGTVVTLSLDGSNSFPGRPKPVTWSIRSAGSSNKRFLRGSQKTKVDLSIKTHLYAEQAATLLAWCATEINAGQTLPWVTTEPAGDLASVTLDHGVQRADGTWRYKRYVGCKVKKWVLACDNKTDLTSFSIDVSGQKMIGNSWDASADPVLTAPLLTAYPVTAYTFQGTAGALTIGTSRTNFTSLAISGENMLFEPFDESHFLTRARYRGRNVDLVANLELKSTPDDRTTFETEGVLATSVTWTNGTHSVAVNLEGTTYIDSFEEDLPLDADAYETLHVQSYLNSTAGTDLAITTT